LPATYHPPNEPIDIKVLTRAVHSVMVQTQIDPNQNQTLVNLLLGTAAVETDLGRNFGNQLHDRGLFQINKHTKKDIVNRVLFKPKMKVFKRVYDKYVSYYNSKQLQSIVEFQALLALIYYVDKLGNRLYRIKNEPWELAWVWKKYYNTHLGRGTTEDFYNKYQMYIEGEG
jgi:hypothetical protein